MTAPPEESFTVPEMLAVTPANTCPAAAKRRIVTTTAPKHFSSRVVCIVPPELTSARLTPRFQKDRRLLPFNQAGYWQAVALNTNRLSSQGVLTLGRFIFQPPHFCQSKFAGHERDRKSTRLNSSHT